MKNDKMINVFNNKHNTYPHVKEKKIFPLIVGVRNLLTPGVGIIFTKIHNF